MRQHTLFVLQIALILLGVVTVWLKPAFGDWLGQSAAARGLRWMGKRPGIALAFVGLCGFCSSVFASVWRGIPVPYAGDELGYLLAADTFAQGRLTNSTPPQWHHFETLNTIFHPTYMSKFPPAQGMFLAVGQLLGGHPAVGVWLSIGLLCAAVTWFLWAYVPPHWAVVGGLIAVFDLGFFSYWSASYWGGAVAGIGGCLLLGAIQRTLLSPSSKLSLLMSLGLVILMLSRPYEGSVFALCCFVGGGVICKHKSNFKQTARAVILPLVMVCILLVAFLGFYNSQITGSWKKLPYAAYEAEYGIAPVFVFQPPHPVPNYRHETFRKLYSGRDMEWYTVQKKIGGLLKTCVTKLRVSLLFYWHDPLILSLLAFALLCRRFQYSGYLLSILGGVLTASLLGVFWAAHYIAPLTGILLLLPTLGIVALWHWRLQDKPIGRGAVCGILLSMIFIPCLSQSRALEVPPFWCLERQKIVKELEQKGGKHLVLVTYAENHNPHDEWVFNRADIPNAQIIWARAMSQGENADLLAAYPQRTVWRMEPDAAPPRLTPYHSIGASKSSHD